MRYGDTDSFLEKFPIGPNMTSMERDWSRRWAEYDSIVSFISWPVRLDTDAVLWLRLRIDKIVELLSTKISREQIEWNREWIDIHVEHDDIKNCYNNYTKEYQILENIAMWYLLITDESDELDFFTVSKKLNLILDQLCNIRYIQSQLERYINEPPDLA